MSGAAEMLAVEAELDAAGCHMGLRVAAVSVIAFQGILRRRGNETPFLLLTPTQIAALLMGRKPPKPPTPRPPGRPFKLTPSQIDHAKVLLSAGEPARDVARSLGVSKRTLARRVR